MKEIEEAVDRVMAGPERKCRVMDEEERRLIAYHEGGHAMVAHVLPNTDEVHKITVIPRGRALGYTLTLPEQDKFLMTREQLRDELAMLMGGRVAEEIVAGDVTTGARQRHRAGDEDRAPDGHRVRHVATRSVPGRSARSRARSSSAATGDPRPTTPTPSRSRSTQEVRQLIDEAHDVALDILTENRAKLDALAARAHRDGDAGSRGGRAVLRRHRTPPAPGARGALRPGSRCSRGRRAKRPSTPGTLRRHARPQPRLNRSVRLPQSAMTDRWATFDCYGTLIDWFGGIRAQLARPVAGRRRRRARWPRYHRIETRRAGRPRHPVPDR